ncbi:putative glycerophosphoryl diester phosphodiesterase 3 [Acorus calamus]|uniref:glycerophosphodiester phosphodiesterase n=1 Tax=Acorus calamus TaxID=4465 RepID=A0AAV9ESZ1_ACOCL|nr:putative glycerophosphoryl diester phosphodiesterase 3 [Acorus calamus]
MLGFQALLFLFVLPSVLLTGQSSNGSTWQTLDGKSPIVIANGGFSGLFPSSGSYAYQIALTTSLPNVVLWCDVQLTKDGVGICVPNILLDNCTNIPYAYPKLQKTYIVNGVSMKGWFSKDFTMKELGQVFLTQAIYSRSPNFDAVGNINAVSDVARLKPPGLWLNIQYDTFYTQNKLSMRSFLLSASKTSIINYVSSPEVGFLRSITARFKQSKTKLVFRFLDSDAIDPSINRTYGSLLKNLTFIKTFASGILVPKNYIWPVSSTVYVESPTSVVKDAHNAGLEIYASDFANDILFAYNYSYNPVEEYLSFVDRSDFAVDGVLTDFPVSASEAIGCFSHIDKDSAGQLKPLVITHNGASGMYPGCTDLAYQQAVTDQADIIDCNVQITSDEVPICLNSIDLLDGTTVAQVPPFSSRTSTVPEIQDKAGIFTFNFTWEEIQKLSPEISNPEFNYRLLRNPANKNAGSFWKLSQFLAYAKDKPIKGVMLTIENAAYLAKNLGIGIVDTVLSTLNDTGYNNQTGIQVYIRSTNSSVLVRFKQTKYTLVYTIDELISDAVPSTIQDIKHFAHSVVVQKNSIYPTNRLFVTGLTGVVDQLHAANLTVYSYLFQNEFVTQAWDFYSDPIIEINTFVQAAKLDGVITDFPETAVKYRKNTCLGMKNMPPYMQAVPPGGLLGLMQPSVLPPAQPPSPLLTVADVAEPPLLAVTGRPKTGGGESALVAPAPPPPGNGQTQRYKTAATEVFVAPPVGGFADIDGNGGSATSASEFISVVGSEKKSHACSTNSFWNRYE